MEFEIAILSIISIIFLSTMIRSTFGFGDAVIAMPLLALILDLKIATPLFAIIALTISFIILIDNWKKIHFKHILRLIVSTAIGIPIGLYILKETSGHIIKFILGIIIIIFSIYNIFKPKLIKIKNNIIAYLFGFFAGVLGGAYNVNGPPIVFYATLKKWDPPSFRGTLQGYFF